MVASRITAAFAEESGQASGSRLRSPQAGVSRAAILSNEKFRGVRLYVSETS